MLLSSTLASIDVLMHLNIAQCLKSRKKVSFKIASEASNVYFLSGQKVMKIAKNGQFGEFLKMRQFM